MKLKMIWAAFLWCISEIHGKEMKSLLTSRVPSVVAKKITLLKKQAPNGAKWARRLSMYSATVLEALSHIFIAFSTKPELHNAWKWI